MLIVIATIGVLISMGLVFLRGVVGPTIYDRLLAANSFGTNIVVMIALLAFFTGHYHFLDIALVYALINYITTIAFLKFFGHDAERHNK